ncbi:hypothetical protein WEH80_37210 [Actinomycetes bacterium KLBMP 9759]
MAGVRIELGEIEAALASHPRIRQCAVTFSVTPGSSEQQQLVGYYVADHPLTDSDLQEFLGERLPSMLVPRRWRALAHLPQTPNGKVDHHALDRP